MTSVEPLSQDRFDGRRRPRLLIADDEALFRSVLSSQLQPHFDVVASVEDGDAVIALAAREQPDVVLIDVQMPGGGPRVAAAIRDTCPSTAVVVLSMDESASSVLEFVRSGATAYLRKGIPVTALVTRLHQAIEAQRQLAPAAVPA